MRSTLPLTLLRTAIRNRFLLEADDHRVGAGEVLDARLAEARLAHPALAVGAGVVEAARRLDEHVEAHQKPGRVLAPVIVNQRLVDDERAARRERVVSLLQQLALLLQVPVVEDCDNSKTTPLATPV